MKKRGKNKNQFNIIVIIIVIVIIIAIMFVLYRPNKSSNSNEANYEAVSEITPQELAANKEKYEGKTVTIKGAYVPSEAFIYVRNKNVYERIYLKPPNRIYCRNFDLEGVLENDQASNRWIFKVENSVCLDI